MNRVRGKCFVFWTSTLHFSRSHASINGQVYHPLETKWCLSSFSPWKKGTAITSIHSAHLCEQNVLEQKQKQKPSSSYVHLTIHLKHVLLSISNGVKVHTPDFHVASVFSILSQWQFGCECENCRSLFKPCTFVTLTLDVDLIDLSFRAPLFARRWASICSIFVLLLSGDSYDLLWYIYSYCVLCFLFFFIPTCNCNG